MKHVLLLVLLLSADGCCCGPPTEPQDRVHAVRLDMYYLLARDEPLPPQGGPSGAEHARVVRQVPCAGVVRTRGRLEDPCGLQAGESTLLPAGTALHVVPGFEPRQRLAAAVEGRLLTFHIYFPPD